MADDNRAKLLKLKAAARLRAEQEQQPKYRGTSPFGDAVTEGFGDAALGLVSPPVYGDALAAVDAGLQTGVANVGSFLGFGNEPASFADTYADAQQRWPASMLRAGPRFTTNKAAAGVDFLKALAPGGQSPMEAYEGTLTDLNQQSQLREQQYPIRSLIGDAVGQGIALGLGRAPAGPKIKSIEEWIARYPAAFAEKGTMLKVVEDFLNAPSFRKVLRGGFRAGEAGTEAAALSILNSSDPSEAIPFAVGTQVAGSGVLSMMQGARSMAANSPGLAFLATALGTASIAQIVKDLIPGGADDFNASVEFGFEKVSMALGLGMIAGLIGAGRVRGEGSIAKNAQEIADAVTSMPRTAVIAGARDLLEAPPDKQEMVSQTFDIIFSDPSALNEQNLKKLNKALKDGQFIAGFDSLWQDPQFVQRLFARRPPELPGGQ